MLSFVPRMKLLRMKFIIIICIVLAVYLYLFYLLAAVLDIRQTPLVLSSVKLPYVVVHLDLKGAPLKLKYLESILPMLKNHGVNGLLIEYEDMFPYDGKLVNISAKDCYGKNELRHFLKAAVQLRFEVIPLIQTFGHMEHVLKLQEFKHLREDIKYPDSICPSKMESRALIAHMLEQVINFHYSVVPLKYIHIGCDEVYNICKCQQCISKGMKIIDLFADHVRYVADTVTKLSPDSTVLFWDDMLREINLKEFSSLNLFHNIEPVYWSYGSDVQVSHISLFNYHQKFENIWIASAFKGADGKIASVPSFKERLSNHFSWMNVILDYRFGGEKDIYKFKGIILTGWSRYNHFSPLCELFPVALPSLIANLLLVDKFKTGFYYNKTFFDINTFYNKHILKDLSQSLKCGSPYLSGLFSNNPLGAFVTTGFDNDLPFCDFEGRDLYKLINDYETLKFSVEEAFTSQNRIYASIEYYAKANFVNVIEQGVAIRWFKDTLVDLNALENNLTKIMKKYYSDSVIQEYVNYKMYSLKKNLKYHLKLLLNISSSNVWDRNPFNTSV